MIIPLELGEKSYDIILERGSLGRADSCLKLDRKVLVVTDTGVPKEYARRLADACREPVIVTVEQGEGSKSLQTAALLAEGCSAAVYDYNFAFFHGALLL